MAWLRLDTSFVRHRKLAGLSYQDRWRHLEAMSWCAEMGTDGVLEWSSMALVWPALRSRDGRAMASRMVAAGLWEKLSDGRDGWQIHDWSDYNLSAESSKAMRKRETERKRKWRERRSGVHAGQDAGRDAGQAPDVPLARKTRPDPPLKGGGEEGRADLPGAVAPSGPGGAQAPPAAPRTNGNGHTSDAIAHAAEASPILAAALARREARGER